jgi:cytochrome c556
MRLIKRVSLLVLLCAAATPLTAAAPDPIAVRIEGLRALGAAFKTVNDEIKSGTPQPIMLQLSARQIKAAAVAQYTWFPAGSGPRPGAKTAAKPEIWAQPVQFKAAQDAFNVQAQAFAKIAGSGDLAKLTAQTKALGQTCGGCHKAFRVEKK